MNQPVTPAMTATIVPASSALTMKGSAKSWRTSSTRFQDSPWKTAASTMVVPVAVHERRFGLSDDDQSAVRGVQHFDRRAVETAERLTRDHLVRPALDCAAAGEVDDAVGAAGQRDAPARTVQPELDKVDAADPGAGFEVVPLREVPDPRPCLARCLAEHHGRSSTQRQQAEDRLDQRRLAGAVRPQECDELAA